jgi:hypothetical protein
VPVVSAGYAPKRVGARGPDRAGGGISLP